MDYLNLMKICKQNIKFFSSLYYYSVFCSKYFVDWINNKKIEC